MSSVELISNYFLDDVEFMEKKNKAFLKRLITATIQSDYDELLELDLLADSTRFSGQAYIQNVKRYSKEKQTIYNIGYAIALMDVLHFVENNLHNSNEIEKVRTKYRDALLKILYDRGTVMHKDLAAKLGVSNNNLTAIISRMNSTAVKLVNIQEISKYKIYSLTPVAYQYVQQLRARRGNVTQIERQDNEKIEIYYSNAPFASLTQQSMKNNDKERKNKWIKCSVNKENMCWDTLVKIEDRMNLNDCERGISIGGLELKESQLLNRQNVFNLKKKKEEFEFI